MGSLDNVYDSIQKLEDYGIEYLLITIDKGKKQGKADVFYSLKDRASMKILSRGLEIFNEQIDKIEKEQQEDQNEE
jgi:soluble cytochrome b562